MRHKLYQCAAGILLRTSSTTSRTLPIFAFSHFWRTSLLQRGLFVSLSQRLRSSHDLELLLACQACHEAQVVAWAGGCLAQGVFHSIANFANFRLFALMNDESVAKGSLCLAVTEVEVKPRPWPLGSLSGMPWGTSCGMARRVTCSGRRSQHHEFYQFKQFLVITSFSVFILSVLITKCLNYQIFDIFSFI